MPLKWRVYYACCWCYLFWLLLVLATGVYMLVSDTDQSYSGYWMLIFPLVIVGKPVLSLKFIAHFKNQTYYTKNTFIAYSLYFMANIIFTFYVAITFVLMVVHEQQSGWDNIITTMMIIISLLFLFASGYFIKFDMPLKNLIRNQRFTQVNTIGNDV